MAALPVVSNVTPLQRPGTKLVDVAYTLADPDSPSVTVSLEISSDGGTTWFVRGTDLSGDFGLVAPGNRSLTWNAAVTWDLKYTPAMRFRIVADERAAPAGFTLIPQGTFEMGEFLAEGLYTGGTEERPLHSASISPFYIARHELDFATWKTTQTWATARGYSFLKPGTGKADTHPVNDISWNDALKWCNAASEKEGLLPCYTTTGGAVYRTGNTNLPAFDWTKNGYRLPTSAEWERAARGGVSRRSFPWGNTATNQQANYLTDLFLPYDVSTTRTPNGLAPGTDYGEKPFTMPVGSYLPNGFGMYNVVGNVAEWIGDHGRRLYTAAPVTDPRGPTGSAGWTRGGSYDQGLYAGRLSGFLGRNAHAAQLGIGFRLARTPVPGGTASAISASSIVVDTGGVAVPPGTIGRYDTGGGLKDLVVSPSQPPAAEWVVSSGSRSLTMNKGDVPVDAAKTAASEIISLTGVNGDVFFTANLNVRDLTAGYEADDTFLAVLIYNGDTANPVVLTAPYDANGNGTMNGSELCPVPSASPTVQEFNYRLFKTIPDTVSSVQLVITGLNDSINEFMTVNRILLYTGPPDSDGDGINNADEMTMSTRIDDPLDVCRISPSTGSLEISNDYQTMVFQTRIGSYYRLYVSDDLQGPDQPLQIWRDAGWTTFTGNNAIHSFLVDKSHPGTRFYRLRVQRADEDWPAVTP